MAELLRAAGLAAGYNGHPVVRNLDLQINAGEVVALVGANGAGKTTSLMALAGVLPPLEGEVLIDGKPTRAPLHMRARNGLAYVTEDRSVFMRLTVRDNLRVGDCSEDAALAIFPELELHLKKLAGQLSGGEQQMLTLARALGRRPTVLLADELSLGLAPLIVKRLLLAVRSAADIHQVGALIVEQHVGQALRIADSVYAMRRGEIVLAGTVAETESRLQEAYL